MFDHYYSLAAANIVYFKRYAPALAMSALETENSLKIMCVDPDSDALLLIRKINELARKYTYETTEKPAVLALPFWSTQIRDDDRVYYACTRFICAEHQLQMHSEMDETAQIHCMDIDSIFMKKMEIPEDVKIGLYLREDENLGANDQEKRGMKILGHMVVSTPVLHWLTKAVDFMNDKKFGYWFLDQEALWYSLSEADKRLVWDMKGKHMLDWDYTDPDTMIWSGKGPRKHSAKTYVKLYDEYTAKFNAKFLTVKVQDESADSQATA